jgi:hypothetical protein
MTDLQLPAWLASLGGMPERKASLAFLASGAVPYISIKGNRFLAIDATGNERPVGQMDSQSGLYLDVVIVDFNPTKSKVFYAHAYDPNASEFVPPDCWSDNGVGPSSQASKPQATLCASCPQNAWGSDTSRITGKGTKACADVQKIAVLLPGQEMLFLMRIPPASLKFLGKYAAEVEAQMIGGHKADITWVVTRVSFDQKSVGILQFRPVSLIDEVSAKRVALAWQNHETDTIVGKNDKPYTGAVAAPAAISQGTTEEGHRLPPPRPVDATALGQAAVEQAVTEEKPKGRGRPKGSTKKDNGNDGAEVAQAPFMQQAGAPTPQGPSEQDDDALAIPGFLKRTAEPEAKAAATTKAGSFGMQEADAPDEGMQARLDDIFKLPT